MRETGSHLEKKGAGAENRGRPVSEIPDGRTRQPIKSVASDIHVEGGKDVSSPDNCEKEWGIQRQIGNEHT